MPFATFLRVREVSSEDDVHRAESLIRPQPGKKWKTKDTGEKNAYVILEMDGAQKITGIDIGNEHSAYVEVLVGKAGSAEKDFVEILITCSFMTPIECRSSNNPNRVRCFSGDALVPTVADGKWSLIKIICTQPFNKHVQYGLSFIKIHVASETEQKTTKGATTCPLSQPLPLNFSESKIGKFKLREDSPDSDVEGALSLFSRWQKTKNSEEPTTASAIRAATIALKASVTPSCSQKHNSDSHIRINEVVDRNRDSLVFGDDIDEVKPERKARLEKQIEADRRRRSIETQKNADAKRKEDQINKGAVKRVESKTTIEKQIEKNEHMIGKATLSKNAAVSAANTPDAPKKRRVESKTIDNHNVQDENMIGKVPLSKVPAANDPEAQRKRRSSPAESCSKRVNRSVIYRPFGELLRGVVLVISGIQNPDRGQLRSKALAMGAKYKGDWDQTCTHLICAFKNTPKYNQVKGKGKIVTRSWIEKCYDLKKYIPWRRFALDSQEVKAPESDEEIFDEQRRPAECSATSNASSNGRASGNDTLALYDLEEQVAGTKQNKESNKRTNSFTSSGSDTDDDIRRIENEKKGFLNTAAKQSGMENQVLSGNKDVYEASTDEEDYLQDKAKQRG